MLRACCLLCVAAATTPAVLILRAGENRSASVDWRSRNRTTVKTVVKCVNFIGKALGNQRVLSRLRCCELLHTELLAKILDFLILRVNLVLTELVNDALRACGLACDNISDAIREGCTVSAILCEDGRGLLGVAELDVRRELCGLHLDSVEALHHAHVGCVEALIDCVLRGVEAVAERHLHVPTAVAELCCEVLDASVDALQRGLNHLVTEPAVDVLGVVEPRVKLVSADSTSSAAVATVAVEAAEQDEQQQNPSLLP